MKIWILNHYATNQYFDGTGRHQAFAKYLTRKGHDVKIFCANTVHNSDIIVDTEDNNEIEKIGKDDARYVFVNTRKYTGNGKDRVLNMLDFYTGLKRALNKYEKIEGKPDVIIASSVHPLTLVAGLKWGSKRKIKCICEIRDLWPESIVEFTDFTRKNLAIKLLYRLEKWTYKKADALIFTMEGGCQYILDKKWEDVIDLNKIYHINNGVDLELFNENRENNIYEAEIYKDTNKINIVYAGSVRAANNVKNLAYVAKELKERNIDNINIFIYGDGSNRKYIENYIDENKLDNIHMMGKVEKIYIPSILSRKNNINCLNYQYSEIFRYGGSQNKLFEYLASGNPVLANVRMGYDIVEKYDAGIVVGSDDINDWVKAILYLVGLDKHDYNQMCENAKKAASDYDFKVLTDKLIYVIDHC